VCEAPFLKQVQQNNRVPAANRNPVKQKECGRDMDMDRTLNLPQVLPCVNFTRNAPVIPRDFVLPGLPAGKVGVLSAPGGTGKSFLLLELAISVATGVELLCGVNPGAPGAVRYVSFEEDETDLHNRLVAIFSYFDNAEFPTERLFVSSLEGKNLPLTVRDESFLAAAEWLEEQCNGMRLVVLDPFSKLHESEENSNPEMKRLIQVLIATAQRTRCAILVAHHTGKTWTLNGGGDQQQSARGASAIMDDVRLGMTLHKPKEGGCAAVLSWPKMNGHAPIKPIELQRGNGGVLYTSTAGSTTHGVCYGNEVRF